MEGLLQYRQPCAGMEKELLPGFVTYFQEVHMLVAKVKALNQWMECETCRLQQVKVITPQKPEDRICIHCRGTQLKEIPIYSR